MDGEAIIRKGIINALAATGDLNIKNDAAVAPNYPGSVIVCELNTVSPPVEIMRPFPKDQIVKISYRSSVAEVTQKALVGRLAETVVASTTYKIELGNNLENYETGKKYIKPYKYTAPAVLTGTANTDRLNMYTDLVTKINDDSANHVTAYLVHSVAFTLGATALFVIGETATQLTSGVTCKIAGVNVTSGSFTGGDAAGTIYVYDVSDISSWLATSKTLTGASTAVVTTAAALTQGQAMMIVDDANYYPPRPYKRRGITSLMLTAGFATATIEIGVATLAMGTTGLTVGINGVYSMGIGSRMLQDVPSFTPDGVYIVEGEAGFVLNALPVSGKTYRKYTVVLNTKPADKLMPPYKEENYEYHEFYVDESDGTKLTAFNGALQTHSAVTITGA